MSERLGKAQQLGRAIDAGWRREDVEAQLARLHDRRRARRSRRALAAPLAVTVIAASLAGLWTWRRGRSAPAPIARAELAAPAAPRAEPPAPAPAAPAPAAASAGALALGDGSVVTPLAADSRLLARRVSDTEVVVALSGGDARFDVPDRQGRRFQAEVGALALETRGAAFRVRLTGPQIEVVAERGELHARWGRERRVVLAGETRSFPTAARAAMASAARDEAPAAPEAPSWRDAAARDDYAAAWDALGRTPGQLETTAELLLAGDVARLSGHPAAAVGYLARALAAHPEDPRAPLAAFTLARIHLEELGAPRDAALAFARTRELAPGGPLAEDALAREVEAWSRAGEAERASASARAYLERYPQGRRLRAVRRFGGVEPP